MLKTALEAYNADPVAFRARMVKRAANLWLDGYTVSAALEEGTFHVLTPNDDHYTVVPIDEGCTCAYQSGQKVPQVPCKHLLGLEGLVEAQRFEYIRLSNRHRKADPEYSHMWQTRANELAAHWRETVVRVTHFETQATQAEEQADGEAFMNDLHTELDIKRYL